MINIESDVFFYQEMFYICAPFSGAQVVKW